MEKLINISDDVLGVLKGRDCIFLDTVMQDGKGDLVFKGEINGSLASKINKDVWIPYTLTFHQVIAYSSCELDVYTDMADSDLDIVENSKRLAELPAGNDMDKSKYKHYRLFTYDYVYDILAVSFDMVTGGIK